MFCKKELVDGGVVQEDGAILCLSCDQRTAKAFRKHNPNDLKLERLAVPHHIP